MKPFKDAIDISFAQGLDTKTDPKRVAIGNFVSLENTVFTKGGLLQKRNGYGQLASLPDATSSYVTTLNGNLTAVGTRIAAYDAPNASWVARGQIQPLSLNTLPILRNNLNQTSCDSAVAPNGLVCTVYLESNGSSTANKYVIADSGTGQNVVAPAAIPVASGTVAGGMRVFVLGNYFILAFTNTIAGTHHLQYVAISTANPSVAGANTDIASSYVNKTTLSWDGYVAANGNLYLAYNTTSGGQAIKLTYLTPGLTLVAAKTYAGQIATMVSVTADATAMSQVYVSYWDASGSTAYTLSTDQHLNPIFSPQETFASGTYLNITSAAQNGSCLVMLEASNTDANTGLVCNYIEAVTVSSAGVVGTPYVLIRSLGLASKAFVNTGVIYVLGAFSSAYQDTYFLVNASLSTSAAPLLSAKLAYSNGGGYLLTGLPGVSQPNGVAWFAYLYKDLIAAVNKQTNVPTGTQVNGIFSQTGINIARIEFGPAGLGSAEIGLDLHLTGGFLWMYDGYLPVEHNFFLWPDTNQTTPTDSAVWSASGGSMHAEPDGATTTNAYFYQFTYEWTDNQGNAFRSAPSIPVAVTTSGSGTSGSVTLNIPTLRLTMKTANPVKVVAYRWSVGQQEYYQVTSITTPLLNDPTVDSVQFVDTLADPSILGNNLIYTTGGVVEDVNAPASNLMTLFDTRLWLVDAEDQNLLWYSKQVIESTPVEMSDLFTFYIAPTTAAQGSTGPITAIAPMDDKLIIFKQNAMYYINGSGPDNTGAGNGYSQPIFITSTVGCANQQSIVFMPNGLMFQSDKGIWLLDRGSMQADYVGAPVEKYNTATVESAQNIPETNQVRFILDSGKTLMFDYYYGQWGTFAGVPAVSSCIYGSLHTFINKYGQAYQETPGAYVDGSTPVLMQFTTGPLRLGQLQNYQRAFFFYLMGDYISPHKLNVNVFFDYSPYPAQGVLITPNNFAPNYGVPSPYGSGSPYGGPLPLEQWRVFFSQQRCQAFAISIQEIYDSTLGVPPGAGLTLSGLNVVCGFKSKFYTSPAANSAG